VIAAEDPHDDPSQQQGLNRQTATDRRDEVYGARGDERSGEREGGEAHGLPKRQAEPEALPDHDPERGTGRDPEHGGLGERVSRERLERDAGDRERAAGEHSGGDPRQANRQGHDPLDRLGRGSSGHRRDDGAGRELRAAEKERAGRGEDEHARQRAQHQNQAPGRAHRNASGWIARASCSRPSTKRGP